MIKTTYVTDLVMTKDIYKCIAVHTFKARWITLISLSNRVSKANWSETKPTKRQLRKWVKDHKTMSPYFIY